MSIYYVELYVTSLFVSEKDHILAISTLYFFDNQKKYILIFLKIENYVHTETCTQMFTPDLFIIVNIWEQPRCQQNLPSR